MKLVECVPNFSEGRDRAVIDQIAAEITRVEGVRLLEVDPGADTNRTVVTFVGEPEAAKEAAFRAIRRAAELIDMRKHKGAHPRMGATDVCPFIPVAGTTMEECAELARALGRRVAAELAIPVYLYEAAASAPERRNLAAIRQGEYEGFPEKIKDPAWRPDFGPPEWNARSGATVIGAREFLIAYNVNLNTRDAKLATEIASHLRESGRAQRDAEGKIVKDAKGEKVMIPGRLKGVKATGWVIPAYGCAQVTMNITSYKLAPFHVCFEETVKVAESLGVRVTGSELVGLIPREAMLEAGRHFFQKQRKSAGQPEAELVAMAVRSMGLGEVAPFDPKKKIIEYHVAEARPLGQQSLQAFTAELSTDSPTPGGGSVAALAGSLGAGLAAMVGNLSYGKKGYAEVEEELAALAVEAQELRAWLLDAVDLDARAFDRVMEAMRLPKASPTDARLRDEAMQAATLGAIEVPLGVLRRAVRVVEIAGVMAEKGFRSSLSDSGVGAAAGRCAAEGAYLNVLINLPGLSDEARRRAIRAEADKLHERVVALAYETFITVKGKL